MGNWRCSHHLDSGSAQHGDSSRIIGPQTAEFLEDGIRNEHPYAPLIQLIQETHPMKEDYRRGVDDATQIHSRPPL
jgi:hypothetical protein